MAESADQLLAMIRSSYSELDTWRERVAHRTSPEPGSELALDDDDWPAWPVSEMAGVGLAVAFDHLDAVRHTIETHRFFPLAQTTLIRAALIGAAQSVWLLAPDDATDRRARNRRLVAYTYSQHGILLRTLLRMEPTHENTQLVAAHVDQRETELAILRKADQDVSQFSTTTMITEAAKAVLLPHVRGDAEAVWRQSSGAAHGQPWAVLGSDETTQDSAEDQHGRATFVAVGGPGRIANAFLCVVHLARQGWGLRLMRGAAQ